MDKNFRRIKKEYENFREEVLLLSKEEIMNNAYKINFYHEVWSFIEDTERKVIDKMSLADLYDFYLSKEYTRIGNYDEIEELFEEYEATLNTGDEKNEM